MQHRSSLAVMTLGALGVVFGDIGTSPLYALKECFNAANAHHLPINDANVMGILSTVFWAIMFMVTFKYVAFIMRADNHGEGGIMALLALNMRNERMSPQLRKVLVAIGLFGAALFFGDGMITPAVSVLSAVEGLSVATPLFQPYIIPITLAVLVGLFMIQRHGTGSMGKLFGPVMLVWFLALGIIGALSIIKNLTILKMFNPIWAVHFFVNHLNAAFFILGAVVLTITGGEALYADMGHFGRRPIQLAWFFAVIPCLLLNYAGQGALILNDPKAAANPFFLLIPSIMLYPMIALATLATVIASQAVISGVFSIARQAMQLGYLPRMSVLHTSESEIGQIYIPFLNWTLLIAVLALVLLFKSSDHLAAAYGIAVTMTMACDTLLVSFVLFGLWRWSLPKVLLLALPFLMLDLLFFGATSLKILDGGWVPLLIGATSFILMVTWKRGREIVYAKMQTNTLPLDLFMNNVGEKAHIVPGTAIFMTTSPTVVPHALLHNLKHNKILHNSNVLLTIKTLDVPYVTNKEERYQLEQLAPHFRRIIVHYGFKEQPDVPKILTEVYEDSGYTLDMMTTSFFVSRERIIHTVGDGMAPWREKLFISMSRNTSAASDFFQIPPNRVVELGSQIEI